jgi:Zn-dependent peptidase ImmA (M78 family)/DNA-binding XRE family transcriptional regulator
MKRSAEKTGMSEAQEVNPRLIVVAREARGLTQAELAISCGLKQSHLSKIEAGILVCPSDRVAALAQVLGVLPEFFASDARVGALGSSCLQFRKRQSLPTKKLREIIARANISRIQIERLLQTVELEQRKFIRLDVDEYGSPERIAQLLRRALNLPMGPIHNLVETVENAGGIVVRTDFGTEQFDAASQWFDDLPPVFFINGRMPADRGRLTLAHEIGHVTMHAVAPIDAEREANRFAAEFLMPADEIRADLEPVTVQHLAELKRYWKVSMQSLLYRARELGVITPRKFTSMMMLFSKLGYRRREPIDLAIEEPTLLRRVVELHRLEHQYTVGDLARLMLVPVDEIPPEFLPGGFRIVSGT